MNGATAGGGSELLPGSVVQGLQPFAWLAQPLKLGGADPPLSELSFHHWAPQNVTVLPTIAFWSPITNMPVGDGPFAAACAEDAPTASAATLSSAIRNLFIAPPSEDPGPLPGF